MVNNTSEVCGTDLKVHCASEDNMCIVNNTELM